MSTITLTEELFRKGLSSNSGWSRKQMEVLGLQWPLLKGWRRRIIGKEFPKEVVEQFLRLKDSHLPGGNQVGLDECPLCGRKKDGFIILQEPCQGEPYDEVARLRAAIRRHMNMRGDDRCYQDDHELYSVLPEGDTCPNKEVAVTLENCERYIQCRQSGREYVSPQRRIEELEAEVARLQAEAVNRDWLDHLPK